MRISYNNFIDTLTAGSIIASSEIPNKEASNLLDERISIKWGSSSASTQSVVITFPSASAFSVTTGAILGHNITSGTSVLLQANVSDSWGTPSFSTALTVIETGAILKFITAQEYQYWRFVINQADLNIGRLWLGDYITIDPSSLLDFSIKKERSDVVTYTKHRQKFASPGVTWRSFKLNFPPTETTMLTAIDIMFNTVGKYKSVIFCNFDLIRDFVLVEPCYCSIVSDLSFSHVKNQKYKYVLELEENL